MKPSQIIASLLMVGYMAVYLDLAFKGSFISLLVAGEAYRPFPYVTVIILAVAASGLMQAIALWTPSKKFLLFAAATMIPAILLALGMAMMFPLSGLGLLVIIFIWFCAASSRWAVLNGTKGES